jgi:hypothetical protein
MDVNDLKGRVAEALVESIFRRASYRVARVGRESQVHGLVKIGAGEFAPDFLVWKQVFESQAEQPVQEYEGLVRDIFGLLNTYARPARSPSLKKSR